VRGVVRGDGEGQSTGTPTGRPAAAGGDVVETTDDVTDGRAARWAGQQQRRREEFVDAAVEAIAEHGPETSVEQIAARAGVARTRLYRHFAGLDELNRAIASRVEAQIVEGLAPAWDPSYSPDVIIRTAVATHLEWLTDHHALYGYLVRHSVITAAGRDVVTDVKRLISDMLVALLEQYVVLLGLDARLTRPLSFGLVGMVDGAASQWVDDPQGVGTAEMVDQLAGLVWSVIDGVLSRAGLRLDPSTPLDAVGPA